MKIEIEKLSKLEKKADEIFFDAEGEKVLLQILEIEQQVCDAKDRIKKQIEESALKLNPNFKSIRGDKIKVGYRYFGNKYTMEQGMESEIPAELTEKQVKYNLKIKELEAWITEHNRLPNFVHEVERQKTITISLIDKKDDKQ